MIGRKESQPRPNKADVWWNSYFVPLVCRYMELVAGSEIACFTVDNIWGNMETLEFTYHGFLVLQCSMVALLVTFRVY